MKNKPEFITRLGINEGIELHVYKDSKGYPTIGIGQLLDAKGLQTLKAVGISNPMMVLSGQQDITLEQAHQMVELTFPSYEKGASESLAHGIYDTLSDARQIAIVDMCYNMGIGGLRTFVNTLNLINHGQVAKNLNLPGAHDYYVSAGANIRNSQYAKDVGNRALRNAAMIQVGTLCNPIGNGSDIL